MYKTIILVLLLNGTTAFAETPSSNPSLPEVKTEEPAKERFKLTKGRSILAKDKVAQDQLEKGPPLKLYILNRPEIFNQKDQTSISELFKLVQEKSKMPMEIVYVGLEALRAGVDENKFECQIGLTKKIIGRVTTKTLIETEPFFIGRIMAYSLKKKKRPESLSSILDQRIVAPEMFQEDLDGVKKMMPELYYATNIAKAVGELQSDKAKFMFAMMPLAKDVAPLVTVGTRVSVASIEERFVCFDGYRTRDIVAFLNKTIEQVKKSKEFENILLKYYTKEHVEFIKTYH